ncbi:hypothetical protein [Amycolatopsis sp. NPDC051071]|uniref:hypothetical protein n=1 Tax=Amycolatopsis sp. NPDC051071 TaxID=3154637 RepID=UPI0034356852
MFRATVNDVLLTGLALAVTRWRRDEGRAVLVDVEGHVREEELASGALERVRAHLDGLPSAGLGHGLLRYLNSRTASALAEFPGAQIEFNYLGRIGVPEATDWSYAAEAEAAALGADDGMPAAHALTLNAVTEDRPGGPELGAHWYWPEAVLTEESVRELAETWFTALDALAHRAARLDSREDGTQKEKKA